MNEAASALCTARFAARLKELRRARKMSGRGLSSRAGLGAHAVSDLEKGREPGLSTLLALQAALNLPSIEDLLGEIKPADLPSRALADEFVDST